MLYICGMRIRCMVHLCNIIMMHEYGLFRSEQGRLGGMSCLQGSGFAGSTAIGVVEVLCTYFTSFLQHMSRDSEGSRLGIQGYATRWGDSVLFIKSPFCLAGAHVFPHDQFVFLSRWVSKTNLHEN